ncbi:ABC transporter permease [Pectinatus frisingensis]|jgi:putative ABC transport system permease protein|uniref:ABC transporter permease n=1 Tax=Pectinatus frisingensis TaxID=865 RepID=UPI0015F6470D|nr:iron export ABC transporter permease subunit FetB [Pectinatus frisingensis]
MSNWALALTYILPTIAIIISYRERLGLERDIIIGSIRAVIQLSIIGLILKFIFSLDNVFITSLILLIMVYNATLVAAKRGEKIVHAKRISFVSILLSLIITLGALILVKAISYTPSEAIPISGMVVGNSMIALGVLYKNLADSFFDRRDEVEVKLCLGAKPREAARGLIRNSIKLAMAPTVDSMKTMGIVQLPGMMTGLILAGTAPEIAIKYQIMVMFMITGSVTIAGFSASYWAYRSFFNDKAQLYDI